MNIEFWWVVYKVLSFLQCILETEYNKRSSLIYCIGLHKVMCLE